MENAAIWAYLPKNIPEKSTYTGSRAEQDMKGVMIMTLLRSFSVSRAREAMIAGTVHPNPRTMGRKALPESPTFPIIVSIT